jgi:HD-like signal output (HDOD) protein
MFPDRSVYSLVQRSPASLAREVQDLVSMPEVYLRVRRLVGDPDSSLMDIADTVAADPGLTARILRLVNSAYFSFGARVDTVSRAVTLLGTHQIHDLTLATSLIRSFSGIPSFLVNMERFWRRSVLCGVSSRALAEHAGVYDGERMFVAGLLAHLGHLVLYLKAPEVVREALTRAPQEGRSVPAIERELLGFDYAAVGAELLSAWKVPASLVEPVRLHTAPGAAGLYTLEAAVVHVAVSLADAVFAGTDIDTLVQGLDPTAWATLGITAQALDDIRADAEGLATAIAEVFIG